MLNGQKTADVQNGKHLGGPFALQYGSGVVKFRKLQIKELSSAEGPLDDKKGRREYDQRPAGLKILWN